MHWVLVCSITFSDLSDSALDAEGGCGTRASRRAQWGDPVTKDDVCNVFAAYITGRTLCFARSAVHPANHPSPHHHHNRHSLLAMV